MRNYITVGKLDPVLAAVLPIFEEEGGFRRILSITSQDLKNHIGPACPPELVLMNLDDRQLKWEEAVNRINSSLGHIPHYIGVTRSYKIGFDAYKAGFVNVVLMPKSTEKLMGELNGYRFNYHAPTRYCIPWYNDYHYINLNEVVLVKADNYTSEFVMKDGSCIHNFKNLKTTHQGLPVNFQRIHRSWVVNCQFVYRINMHKSNVYLRHYKEPIPFTVKYRMNVVLLKKLLSGSNFISGL